MDLLGQWLKVSLYCNSWLCVWAAEWLAVLAVSPEWFIRFAGRRDRGREGEGDNSSSRQAAVTNQLAGCVNSTSDLYGNRAISSPLLADCGNEERSSFPPLSLLLAGPSSSGTEEDMTGQDSFGSEISSGRAELWGFHRRAVTGPRWHRLAVGQAAMQLSSQSLASQRVS